MKKHPFIFILLVLVACGTTRRGVEAPAPATVEDPVARLSAFGVDAIMWQYASAEAHLLFKQGYELARIRLAENMRRVQLEDDTTATAPRIPAVIVDIDETVLDNSPYEVHLVHNHQVYEPASWKAWTDKAVAPALPGAVDFLIHAAELGCEVYYITNRDTSERESTLKNLHEQGFPFVDREHLLLMEGSSDKTSRRAHVKERHPVVLLVGDQLRDFDDRFRDRSRDHGKALVDEWADTLRQYFIMMPNPMYGTFRDAVQGKGTPAEQLQNMERFFEQHSY